MRKFLLRTTVFLVLATILMAVLDVCLTHKLRHYYRGRFTVWNEIFNSHIDADLLIMGSSRAWVHYSPEIIDSVLHTHSYNLGIDGSTFNRQYTRYLIYRKHQPKPRIIIQNFECTTLSFTTGYEQYQYFPYFYDPDIRRWVLPYEEFTIADRVFPFYRYSNFGVEKLFQNKLKVDRGYMGRDKPWKVEPLEDDNLPQFTIDPRTLSLLKQFLSETAAEGIQVIFVHSPTHISLTERQNDVDSMWKTFQQIADQYNIPILNYQSDSLSYDTNYFYNRMHLNRKGAELFTRKLANDLKKGHYVDINTSR